MFGCCVLCNNFKHHALSAWGGYVTKDNINRINKTLAKAKRYGFCSKLYTFNELLEPRFHFDLTKKVDHRVCRCE